MDLLVIACDPKVLSVKNSIDDNEGKLHFREGIDFSLFVEILLGNDM